MADNTIGSNAEGHGENSDDSDYSEDFQKLLVECQRQLKSNRRAITYARELLNSGQSRLNKIMYQLEQGRHLMFSKEQESIQLMAEMANFTQALSKMRRIYTGVTGELESLNDDLDGDGVHEEEEFVL